jgi:rSAM/selenodomain-associated transferase 1
VPSAAIIVMAKFPAPGKVKTRLIQKFSPQQAAAIHQLFLLHFIERLSHLHSGELIVCFDPPAARQEMQQLLAHLEAVTLLAQIPGDLGSRIAAACLSTFDRHPSVLVIGVDSPDVPEAHLLHALRLAGSNPISLSRTDDGGFWSIGLQQTINAAALLSNIPWSTGNEADATLQRAAELGHPASVGMAWDDVDRPEDIARLFHRLSTSDTPADQQLLTRLRHVIPHAESLMSSGAH